MGNRSSQLTQGCPFHVGFLLECNITTIRPAHLAKTITWFHEGSTITVNYILVEYIFCNEVIILSQEGTLKSYKIKDWTKSILVSSYRQGGQVKAGPMSPLPYSFRQIVGLLTWRREYHISLYEISVWEL